jgi:hypothetical protein
MSVRLDPAAARPGRVRAPELTLRRGEERDLHLLDQLDTDRSVRRAHQA